MSTNPYFNFFNQTNDQNLAENLLIESIKIYGFDMYYIKRNIIELNEILGEEVIVKFDNSWPVEMYIKNVEGFGGQGTFLAKFGLEIRDEITFTVSQTRFKEITGLNRPYEGDLIWFPFNNNIFEIKFVEHEDMFFELGNLKVYTLTAELFDYNHTPMETGNNTFDIFEELNAYTVDLLVDNGNNTDYIESETVSQGNNITAEVYDWDSNTQILTLGNISGNFAINIAIVGSNSGASWIYNPTGNNLSWNTDSTDSIEDGRDNLYIENESANLIISTNNIYGLDF